MYIGKTVGVGKGLLKDCHRSTVEEPILFNYFAMTEKTPSYKLHKGMQHIEDTPLQYHYSKTIFGYLGSPHPFH